MPSINPDYLNLSYWQVGLATMLILINALVSLLLQLRLELQLAIAAVRTIVQLLLVGLVLQTVFKSDSVALVLVLAFAMALVAGYSAVRRTKRRYPGIWLDTLVSMWASSWMITGIALLVILQAETWYSPQYSIPILGMILGNTLNGISLGLDRFNEELINQRGRIETLLALGATRWEAARAPLQEAMRTGMIPIINSMMVVGIVSLPGMMTGQMLGNVPPIEAVKYQIVIMFLIASGTALGTVSVILLAYQRMFNHKHQFLHGRLRDAK